MLFTFTTAGPILSLTKVCEILIYKFLHFNFLPFCQCESWKPLRPLYLDDKPCIAAPTQTICAGSLPGQLRGFGSYFSTSLDLDDNGYKYVCLSLKSSTTTKYENREKIFPPETSRLVPRALAMLLSSGLLLPSICNAGAALLENDDWSQAQSLQDSACGEVQGVDHL